MYTLSKTTKKYLAIASLLLGGIPLLIAGIVFLAKKTSHNTNHAAGSKPWTQKLWHYFISWGDTTDSKQPTQPLKTETIPIHTQAFSPPVIHQATPKSKQYDLSRFLKAQNKSCDGYKTALTEIKNGQKQSCWIWYIFPQLDFHTKAVSQNTRFYAINNLEEAIAYLQDPVLGHRLKEITKEVQEQKTPLRPLMGKEIDVSKFISSMTLFSIAARTMGISDADNLFLNTLNIKNNGEMDEKTVKMLKENSTIKFSRF